MIAELGVFLLIALEYLAVSRADLQEKLSFVTEVTSVDSIQHGCLLTILNGKAVGDGEVALCEGKVMEGVQEVRFPHPIEADEAVDLGRKRARSRGNALEMQKVQTLKDHERKRLAWSSRLTSHLLLGRKHTAGCRDIFTARGTDGRRIATRLQLTLEVLHLLTREGTQRNVRYLMEGD